MELLSDVQISFVPAPFLPCPMWTCSSAPLRGAKSRTVHAICTFFKLKSESRPAETTEALCLASEGLIWTGAPLKALCLPVSACFSLTVHIRVCLYYAEKMTSQCADMPVHSTEIPLWLPAIALLCRVCACRPKTHSS